MADIDFSNAVFEPVANAYGYKYMTLEPPASAYNIRITDSNGTVIANLSTRQILDDQTNYFVIVFIGTINSSVSGSEMYISMGSNSYTPYWRISNISFQGGDNFSFQIKSEFI